MFAYFQVKLEKHKNCRERNEERKGEMQQKTGVRPQLLQQGVSLSTLYTVY